jgi:hypothetical protein
MGSHANDDEPGKPTLPTPASQHDETAPVPAATPPAEADNASDDDEAATEARRRAALCEEIRAGWKRALGH